MEGEVKRIQLPPLSQLLQRKGKAATEYQDLVGQASKLVGQPYIVMHKRLERAFQGKSVDFVLSYVRRWVHEASKDAKPAIKFNYRFKQYREQL